MKAQTASEPQTYSISRTMSRSDMLLSSKCGVNARVLLAEHGRGYHKARDHEIDVEIRSVSGLASGNGKDYVEQVRQCC